jgi:hypothetical protein
MLFVPGNRGIFAILQAEAGPLAIPENPLADQVTEIVPDPPLAEPVRFSVEPVVLEGTVLTVSVSGPGDEGSLGVPSVAAYSVRMAALSGSESVVTIR